ncbi:MAG: C4-dicarboxylate ABC transporter permease [Propionibacteriales bacterium]|nr:C4-dicarboxylate ABC transporter permease [Propionibacteriales bacterium]
MLEGLQLAFEPASLIALVTGLALGLVFGAIPGLTATLGVALLVPITFIMEPAPGMIMLLGVYAGSIYAGSITAILLRIPGTPASIPTMWDGYALTEQGKPRLALGTAAVASGIGGLFSGLVLIFLSPLLADVALKFGPAEYVAIVLFGLLVVTAVLGGSMVRSAAGVFIGLSLALVGLDPLEGFARLDGGFYELGGGLEVVPVLLGIFCLTEAIRMAAKAKDDSPATGTAQLDEGRRTPTAKELLKNKWNFARSSLIGTGLGIIPAVGPETTPFVSYAAAKRASKEREKYGRGSIEALISAETSNNANVGGSLIPLLTLGIPGSAVAAVFLGALTLQGLRPGPLLFAEQPALIGALFTGFLLINALMLVGGVLFVRQFAIVLRLPVAVLATLVALFSILGAFAVGNNVFNIWVMFAAGALAFVLQVARIPIAPVVLALILGPLLETNLTKALTISRGDWAVFVTSPLALVFLILGALFLTLPVVKRVVRRSWTTPGPEANADQDATGRADARQNDGEERRAPRP